MNYTFGYRLLLNSSIVDAIIGSHKRKDIMIHETSKQENETYDSCGYTSWKFVGLGGEIIYNYKFNDGKKYFLMTSKKGEGRYWKFFDYKWYYAGNRTAYLLTIYADREFALEIACQVWRDTSEKKAP